MNIVINDVAVKKNSGGVYTILREVYESAKKDTKNTYFFILGDHLFEESQNVHIIVRPDLQKKYLKRILFDFGFEKQEVLKYNPDIVVSLQNIAMLRLKNVTQYVYLHQPLPFQRSFFFNPWKKKERKLSFYQFLVGFVIKLSFLLNKRAIVIVQSNWLKNELITRKLRNKEKIIVSQPKIDDNIRLITTQKSADKKIIFFYPSTAMLYKNHKIVVESLKYLTSQQRNRIVIYFTLDESEYNSIVGIEKPEEIILLGRIEHNEVIKMLSKSVLLFPSSVETFGLPILEAKMLSRLILVNDIEVLKETVGFYNRVKYFDGKDAKSLANAIIDTIDNESNTITCFDDKTIDYSNNMQELIEIIKTRR